MASRRAKMSRYQRVLEDFAKSRVGGWYYVNVAGKIDPFILRATKGRVSLSPGASVMLLRTIGAKSGRPRDTALLFARDGNRIILIASKAGNPHHPAWYHNLKAHPEVEVLAPRLSGRYVATEVTDDAERARLWAIASSRYAGYDSYQQRTGGRRIPVVVLSPAA
jgi:deazaflavin-dependent oxidoreductase (nitroreductase family)